MKSVVNLLNAALAVAVISSCGKTPSKNDPAPGINRQPPSDSNKKSEVNEQTGPGVIAPNQAQVAAMGPLLNYSSIAQQIGLSSFHEHNLRGDGVRIAVLDNGFVGWEAALGKRLPADTTLDKGSENPEAETSHGTRMAEIAYAVSRGSLPIAAEALGLGPQIKLYNTNGFSNFSHAIDQVIADKMDIVLYSQVWEYGGNGDGKGFINALVDRVTEQGIVWINAAGNNGESTYFGSVVTNPASNAVTLPYQGQYVRLTIPENGTPVRIVLSWNDFTDSADYKTAKDLDLRLSDCQGNVISASSLIQSGEDPGERNGYSAHAREIITTTLNQGTYCLSVQKMTDNFDANSTLRLTADGYGVSFVDRSVAGQLLIPADNPKTLTVGASDVSYSATAFSTTLPSRTIEFGTSSSAISPDVKVESSVNFGGDEVYSGTSAAAAIAAGAVAVLRGTYGSQLQGRDLTQYLTKRDHPAELRGATGRAADSGRWQTRSGGYIWNPPSLELSSPY